ncbi:MAG: hypothetical protein A3G64_00015 [Candidatus Liptonbacteria bacterium RIFCSPLOWO2_12_FULL_60_15]|uniref:Cytochrome c-type biogenesis protein CcmF C-terminal domain-containing protein n=1 Tax=Candidatus Liptonbacteria bacterium RIFCSPLOWO2_12_FULL_60_15 TaxID=1798653 RepID=A0A1G2CQM2_9BACT|nr:MAG: hypothetical protein A3G64_00015 [Candidatus Liptonbacteria bacterium RIFCSPLOWO2_12_FULL_60_15]
MTLRTPLLVLFVVGAAAIAAAPLLNAHAVTVGPAKQEFSSDPGETLRGTAYVKNETAKAAMFFPSFEEFTEEEGSRRYFTREGGLSSWIAPLLPVSLAPGEGKTLPLIINVPKDAPPGSHFAVIWWSTADPAKLKEGQVTIAAKAGALLYLTVSGEAYRSAQIVSFRAEGGRRFFGGLPIRFSVLIKNEGNVYEKPMGTLTLTNLFGGESARVKVNEFGSQVLPRSQKTLPDIELAGDRFLFGPYRANLDLVYGENAHLSAQTWVFVMPPEALVWMIAIILVIGGAPFVIKKYNAWILRKASRSRTPQRRS